MWGPTRNLWEGFNKNFLIDSSNIEPKLTQNGLCAEQNLLHCTEKRRRACCVSRSGFKNCQYLVAWIVLFLQHKQKCAIHTNIKSRCSEGREEDRRGKRGRNKNIKVSEEGKKRAEM